MMWNVGFLNNTSCDNNPDTAYLEIQRGRIYLATEIGEVIVPILALEQKTVQPAKLEQPKNYVWTGAYYAAKTIPRAMGQQSPSREESAECFIYVLFRNYYFILHIQILSIYFIKYIQDVTILHKYSFTFTKHCPKYAVFYIYIEFIAGHRNQSTMRYHITESMIPQGNQAEEFRMYIYDSYSSYIQNTCSRILILSKLFAHQLPKIANRCSKGLLTNRDIFADSLRKQRMNILILSKWVQQQQYIYSQILSLSIIGLDNKKKLQLFRIYRNIRVSFQFTCKQTENESLTINQQKLEQRWVHQSHFCCRSRQMKVIGDPQDGS